MKTSCSASTDIEVRVNAAPTANCLRAYWRPHSSTTIHRRWRRVARRAISEAKPSLTGSPMAPGQPTTRREDRERYPPKRIGGLVGDNCKDNADHNADQRDEDSRCQRSF